MKYLLGLRQLPFKQSINQIIYVENEYDEDVNRYIQENYQRITQHFKSKGYDFCYIPFLGKELVESTSIRYYAPFSPKDFKPVADLKSDFILKWMLNQEKRSCIKPSLLYYHPYSKLSDYKEAICQFRGITLKDSGYEKTNDLSSILQMIHQAITYYDWQVPRFQLASQEEADEFYNNLPEEKKERMQLLMKLAAEFRQDGVRCAMLDYFTHGQPKVSPVRITKDYRIIISDNNIEVGLAAKSKALYFLFLNHQEPMTYKDLQSCEAEIKEIYRLLKGRDVLPNKMQDSIVKVVTERNQTSWYINDIRGEFDALFEEQISRNYTIERSQNDVRSISLSRENVIWECEMPKPTKIPQIVGKHERVRNDFR